MIRIQFLILLLLLIITGGCNSGRRKLPVQVKKVLLISIDTLRADYLGCYDPQKNTSPGIDQFASESFLFRDAMAQGPSTAISHKSIFYSLYPAIHKTTKETLAQELVPSPLEILQENGYKTAAFVGGGQLSKKFGFSKGFDTYWEAAGSRKKGMDRFNLDFIRERTTAWLKENHSDDFFLFVHTYEVHCPYNPPEPYEKEYASWYQGDIDPGGKCGDNYYNQRHMSEEDVRYVRDLYAGSVRFIDDFVVRILEELKALGIYEETLIIFLSDHGESLGERNYIGHNLPYNIQLHIPLIIRVPGLSGKAIEGPVESVDIMPTVFEVLGLKAPYSFQGRNLIPVILERDSFEADRVRIAQQKDRVRVRKGDWTCIFFTDGNPSVELYDLRTDPEELRNLAAEKPDLVNELKAAFFANLQDAKELSAKFPLGDKSKPDLDEETREQLEALGYVQ